MNYSELRLLESALSDCDPKSGLRDIIEACSKLLEDYSSTLTDDVNRLKQINAELESYGKKASIEVLRSKSLLDCRLLSLALNNIRRFQSVNGRPCGLDFTDAILTGDNTAHKPVSVVLLGANGVGKSSMYDALEWLCTHNIGEANLRAVAKEGMYDYLSTKMPDAEVSIVVKTSQDFKDFLWLPLTAFFCSENDLIEMVKAIPHDDNNLWWQTIGIIGGYGEFVDVIWTLAAIKSKLKDRDFTYASKLRSVEQLVNNTIAEANRFKDIKPEFDYNQLSIYIEFFSSELLNVGARNALNEKVRVVLNYFVDDNRGYNLLSKISSCGLHLEVEIEVIRRALSIIKESRNTQSHTGKSNIPLPKSEGTDAELSMALNDISKALDRIKHEVQTAMTMMSRPYHPYFLDSLTEIKTLLTNTLPDDKVLQEYTDKIVRIIDDLSAKCVNRLRSTVNALIDDNFIKRLNQFYDSFFEKDNDDEPIERFAESKADDFVLKVERRDTATGQWTAHNVVHYFNTFRLKLLVLVIRALIAIKTMKDNNFVFPLVFDDVFYSSDYENKQKLSAFFSALFDFFTNEFGEDKLQLVFFTHDEQILYVAREALVHRDNVVFGRFFDHRRCGDISSMPPAADNKFNNLYFTLV